ncbi:hypothetical protein EVJ50_06780 [Synechococcus sp. RSCCF101]|uniref:hypothetical protein n=1 Tax=Synechococcus sp. RSCCF101 TaxID=2511069 RepID=UPI001247D787|nr:hypothetical protein [Synechococcus sp. RSCCF101]QEY31985.1 hypothetical protein EVJ50_06780 [Synechococcus sp. RSCCF101]
MAEGPRGLTAKQRKAIVLLAQGHTIRGTGREINSRPDTIRHWRDNVPEFSLALERALRRMEREAEDSMRTNLSKAMETLVALLDSDQDGVRLGAASRIFTLHTSYKEHRAQQEELAELKASLGLLQAQVEEQSGQLAPA